MAEDGKTNLSEKCLDDKTDDTTDDNSDNLRVSGV